MSVRQRVRLGASVLALSCTVAMASPAGTPPDAPWFTVEDLGALPPVAADTALGVNASGQVTLWGRTGTVSVRAALWTAGVLRWLDPDPVGCHSSLARGLNDRGQWVGWAVTGGNPVDSLATTRGFVRTGTVTRLLPTLGGRDGRAYAINAHGVVVGGADRADGHCHAFRDDGTAMTDLGTLPGGGFSQATAVNAAGDAVGVSDGSPSPQSMPRRHAVLWHSDRIRDLGTLPGGRVSSAQAVNDRGQAAGYSESPDGYHAVLWSGGWVRDLGTLGAEPSAASGLNNRGEVVGASSLDQWSRHAFLWRGGHMIDLNACIPAGGWVLSQADAVNDRGRIVCRGRRGPGPPHALLLTPTQRISQKTVHP